MPLSDRSINRAAAIQAFFAQVSLLSSCSCHFFSFFFVSDYFYWPNAEVLIPEKGIYMFPQLVLFSSILSEHRMWKTYRWLGWCRQRLILDYIKSWKPILPSVASLKVNAGDKEIDTRRFSTEWRRKWLVGSQWLDADVDELYDDLHDIHAHVCCLRICKGAPSIWFYLDSFYGHCRLQPCSTVFNAAWNRYALWSSTEYLLTVHSLQ